MRYEEEENHWHPSHQHRYNDRRREAPRYRENDNFNDFGSRWGDPDPRMNPRHQDWRQEEGPGRRDRRNPEDDWRPFEHQTDDQHRHNREQDYRSRQEQYSEPVWRQRDRHFNSSNQHANDRWQNNESMPHPDEYRYHQHEDEHRRRRYRDLRED